jgi:hypothetical protein
MPDDRDQPDRERPDRTLQEAFDQLRAEEAERIPSFEEVRGSSEHRPMPSSGDRAPVRGSRPRRRVPDLVAVLALIGALVMVWQSPAPERSTPQDPAPSIASWQAPTDPLLQPLASGPEVPGHRLPTDALLPVPASDTAP